MTDPRINYPRIKQLANPRINIPESKIFPESKTYNPRKKKKKSIKIKIQFCTSQYLQMLFRVLHITVYFDFLLSFLVVILVQQSSSSKRIWKGPPPTFICQITGRETRTHHHGKITSKIFPLNLDDINFLKTLYIF